MGQVLAGSSRAAHGGEHGGAHLQVSDLKAKASTNWPKEHRKRKVKKSEEVGARHVF